ncbi:histidine phosphatase family protein [Jeongeupia naejangsanensis]|uniref:Histidine phosphatase family protein n=1 Tax=Jeongeupia naejangsanensis TaxID=613195 RepID=A0ABS2BPG1_9NEIS|nr:histidine phosphatase family protein [Jeongeupia naejangsanensis]MBM3117526.1 histidine phosphatase family protein [Jeongeupia naejangsanensis]
MSSGRRLSLLRHGETAPAGLIGQHDAPLSPLGLHQLQQRWAALDAVDPVRAVAASDLARCSDFATGMARQHALPCTIDAAFRELDCGQLNGRPAATLDGDAARAYRDWQHDPAGALPGGEDWPAFTERIDTGLKRWLAGSDDGHHVLVTHGGVIKALLLRWLDLPSSHHGRFWPGYAASVSVHWDPAWPPIVLAMAMEAPC